MAVNRFQQPMINNVDLEFFKPNAALWAEVLTNQQKNYDIGQQVLAKRPEYDVRADQSAFDNYLTQLETTSNDITSSYVANGVQAGNKKMADSILAIQQDWNPGGTAHHLMSRKTQFDAYKTAAQTEYKDTRVANHVIDQIYNNPNNAFTDASGQKQGVSGYSAPAYVSAEDRLKVQKEIVDLIKDEVMLDANGNVKKGYERLFSQGYDTVYSLTNALYSIDRDKALEVIASKFPREYTEYGKLEQDAYGADIPVGADRNNLLIDVINSNGKKVRSINPYHPYAVELYGTAEAVSGIHRIDKSNVTLRNSKQEAQDNYDRENTGIRPPIFPGASTSGTTTGSFPEGVTAESMSIEAAGSKAAYEKEALQFANRWGIDVTDPNAAVQRVTNALQLSQEDFAKQFPGENRTALAGKYTTATSQAETLNQLEQLGEAKVKSALTDEQYDAYINQEKTLRADLQNLIDNDTTLSGYTVDELVTMTSGKGFDNKRSFYLRGKYVSDNDNGSLEKVNTILKSSKQVFQEALRIKNEFINERLQQPVIQQRQITTELSIKKPDGTIDARATSDVNRIMKEYTDNINLLMDAEVTNAQGDPVLMKDILTEVIEGITGKQPTEAQLRSIKFMGYDTAPDRNGIRSMQLSFIDDNYTPVPFMIPQPNTITDIVDYGMPRENIENIAYSSNSKYEDRVLATETISKVDANNEVNSGIAKANYHPGTSFIHTDKYGNDLFKVVISDEESGGIRLTTPTGSQTDRYILMYRIDEFGKTSSSPITDINYMRNVVEKRYQIVNQSKYNIQP
jgi:hypothetical protein